MGENSSPGAGHRQRLRSRFARSRLTGMPDYEIIELLLTYAIPRKDVKPLAKLLLERFQDLSGVFGASGQELLSVPGLGVQSATLILFVKDLMAKILEQKVRAKKVINNRSDVTDFLRMKIGCEKKETLIVFFLDSGRHLIDYDLYRGTVDHAVVYVRELTARALLCHANGVILAHNHPSGNSVPSAEDVQLTRCLREALSQLGIELLDHFIVTQNGIESLAFDVEPHQSESSFPPRRFGAADSGR